MGTGTEPAYLAEFAGETVMVGPMGAALLSAAQAKAIEAEADLRRMTGADRASRKAAEAALSRAIKSATVLRRLAMVGGEQ